MNAEDFGRGTKPVLGIDIGGTTTRVALGDAFDGLFQVERFSTRDYPEPKDLIRRCRQAVKRLSDTLGSSASEIAGLSVVVPGSIDAANSIVRHASNLQWGADVPLGRMFEEEFQESVSVENDANAAALGEWHTAGRPAGMFVYVAVGTGIGSGLIWDGAIWRGVDGLAGEVGHTTVDINGPLCLCGNRGCLEAIASGMAMERSAKRAASRGTLSDDVKTPSQIEVAAWNGSQEANRILNGVRQAMFTALRNLACILNPSEICLGGGVIRGTSLLDSLKKDLLEDPLLDGHIPTLRRATLLDEAGIVGALLLGVSDDEIVPRT